MQPIEPCTDVDALKVGPSTVAKTDLHVTVKVRVCHVRHEVALFECGTWPAMSSGYPTQCASADERPRGRMAFSATTPADP
jgi:hypothetical protein